MRALQHNDCARDSCYSIIVHNSFCVRHHRPREIMNWKLDQRWRNRKWRVNIQFNVRTIGGGSFARLAGHLYWPHYTYRYRGNKHVAVRYDLLVHDLFRGAATAMSTCRPQRNNKNISVLVLVSFRFFSLDWILTFVPSSLHARLMGIGLVGSESVCPEFPP